VSHHDHVWASLADSGPTILNLVDLYFCTFQEHIVGPDGFREREVDSDSQAERMDIGSKHIVAVSDDTVEENIEKGHIDFAKFVANQSEAVVEDIVLAVYMGMDRHLDGKNTDMFDTATAIVGCPVLVAVAVVDVVGDEEEITVEKVVAGVGEEVVAEGVDVDRRDKMVPVMRKNRCLHAAAL